MMMISSIPYIYSQHCHQREYLFTTEVVGEETETELTDDISGRGGDFETGVLGGGKCAAGCVDVSNHNVCKVDSEEIIRVGITIIKFSRLDGLYNPTPATMMALSIRLGRMWKWEYRTWYHENVALSMLSKAIRLRSRAASELMIVEEASVCSVPEAAGTPYNLPRWCKSFQGIQAPASLLFI
jgi:hypothetical protein